MAFAKTSPANLLSHNKQRGDFDITDNTGQLSDESELTIEEIRALPNNYDKVKKMTKLIKKKKAEVKLIHIDDDSFKTEEAYRVVKVKTKLRREIFDLLTEMEKCLLLTIKLPENVLKVHRHLYKLANEATSKEDLYKRKDILLNSEELTLDQREILRQCNLSRMAERVPLSEPIQPMF